ncbi:hypothetical protein [Streptomyces tsukubensis]|uniref:Uncharacterized protein n=1 Tax=Streptomyces tsukubensis TaxID=83656 RepID=A0A1V4AFS1_9ACTN|nr:hypothetical protein [Streptomyces tsukubensis]OON82879.1 hypothetical protein B1H18_02330 [Streptomyces tsukubensis]QFR91940.1 hypothetical protein GBW32_01355 [Streptomyces tsukubensis]
MARPTFPPDLIRLQNDWIRAYDDLAQRSPADSATVPRRRLLLLSCRLINHPHWSGPAEWRAARTELRRQARTAER